MLMEFKIHTIIDVPSVVGRSVLVDMASSENIRHARKEVEEKM